MQVRELMKEHPTCITPNATLKDAAQQMAQIECGILPVVEASNGGKRPIGVVTDRDIVVRCVTEGRDPETCTVRDAMTRNVITCDEDCKAKQAFETMRTEKVGRLLVTTKDGELCGILSMADIIARTPSEIWTQLPGARTPQPRSKVAA